MSNIADLIEDYILRRLAEQQNGQVELRRTDIADEISCAPSQISYVLNTRFTHDKGIAARPGGIYSYRPGSVAKHYI